MVCERSVIPTHILHNRRYLFYNQCLGGLRVLNKKDEIKVSITNFCHVPLLSIAQVVHNARVLCQINTHRIHFQLYESFFHVMRLCAASCDWGVQNRLRELMRQHFSFLLCNKQPTITTPAHPVGNQFSFLRFFLRNYLMRIGVLALQGAFVEHIHILKQLGVEAIVVR